MRVVSKCRDEWLLRLLVSAGKLAPEQAQAVRDAGVPFASLEVLRRELIAKDDLAATIATNYRILYSEPDIASIDKLALSLLPEALCRKHLIIPLKLHEDTIELLMANPCDAAVQDEVGAVTGRRPIAFFGLPSRIDQLIDEAYSPDLAVWDLLRKMPDDVFVEWVKNEAEKSPDAGPAAVKAPVIKLANLLISQAIRMKASDIHIEHEENTTHVRYRVDGALRNIMSVPKHIGEGPLISRIKIMAELDVADRRRPQDGRAKLRVGLQEIGLRVSTVPTACGEKAVLRILDQRQAEVRLDALGFRAEVLERLTRLSKANQGLLLITGPTGSGKTTTLYSALHRLKSPDINITTVEDPIEYRLPGINQVQVNEKSGLTFAAVLRSVLRQDPDVVLVGEIRDRETADVAFQASLTGHMVFSTLHTNDTISTINRLLDMGVEAYKMAPSLVGIVSQRLARRICPHCRIEEAADPSIAGLLRGAGLPARQFRGAGCPRCQSSGLSGRIAVAELLDLSAQEARDMISAGEDLAAFRERALERGWLLTMREDVLRHLSDGDIPFEEAASLLGPESARAACRELPRGDARPAPPPPPAPQTCRPRRRLVLVIDDNEDNRLIAREALKADGYEAAEAEDGLKGVEAVSARQPDLILLDIMMPGMDGLAVLKRLRQGMGLKRLPVMIVTAMGEAESQSLALDLGADDYLTKPFCPKVLRSRVRALFRRAEYEAEGPGRLAAPALPA